MNDKQAQVMDIAQEECAELIQAISKVRRFGIDNVYDNKSNREQLIEEIGDVYAMIQLLESVFDIDKVKVTYRVSTKFDKLKKYSSIFGENNA